MYNYATAGEKSVFNTHIYMIMFTYTYIVLNTGTQCHIASGINIAQEIKCR